MWIAQKAHKIALFSLTYSYQAYIIVTIFSTEIYEKRDYLLPYIN